MNKNLNLGTFNGPVPYENRLHYGIYLIAVEFDGKCRVYHAKGKSFVANADASGAGYNRFNSIDEAIKNVREWATYVWNHNDRKNLIEEYGLDRNFVEKFLGYSWPLDEKGELQKPITLTVES